MLQQAASSNRDGSIKSYINAMNYFMGDTRVYLQNPSKPYAHEDMIRHYNHMVDIGNRLDLKKLDSPTNDSSQPRIYHQLKTIRIF